MLYQLIGQFGPIILILLGVLLIGLLLAVACKKLRDRFFR